MSELDGFCTRILRISQQKETENGELWNKSENEDILGHKYNCNFSNLVFLKDKGEERASLCIYTIHICITLVLSHYFKKWQEVKKDITFSSVLISILVVLSVSWLLLSRIFLLICTSHRRLHVNCGVSELLGHSSPFLPQLFSSLCTENGLRVNTWVDLIGE